MTEAKPAALQDNPYFLWAKLPGKDNNSRSFHPLICHMLDVAVVAREMWRSVLPEAARQKLAAVLRLSPEAAQRWITYLAALHDLGKASPAFQMRKEAQHLLMLYQAFGSPPNVEASECPHGRVTAGELPEILASAFDMQKTTADRLAVVIGGHHGTFPTSFEIEKQPTAGVGRGKNSFAASWLPYWLSCSKYKKGQSLQAVITPLRWRLLDWCQSLTGLVRTMSSFLI
jgi:CRISPR-associated endonuclease/helicase Cas3